jgi:hypothetical protein
LHSVPLRDVKGELKLRILIADILLRPQLPHRFCLALIA